MRNPKSSECFNESRTLLKKMKLKVDVMVLSTPKAIFSHLRLKLAAAADLKFNDHQKVTFLSHSLSPFSAC